MYHILLKLSMISQISILILMNDFLSVIISLSGYVSFKLTNYGGIFTQILKLWKNMCIQITA